MKEKEIVFFREGLLQSIVSDLFTFCMISGSVCFNVRFCGNSYFLNGIMLVMFLMMLFARQANRKTFRTKDELKKYLNSEVL